MNYSKIYRLGYLVSAGLIILFIFLWLLREFRIFYVSWPEDLITPALLFGMIGLSFVILSRGDQKQKKESH